MDYPHSAIPERDIPRARTALLQHVVDTYASEINKVVSVWTAFTDSDLEYRPHERSSSVEDNFKHQLLSERRFFGELLSLAEPAAAQSRAAGAVRRRLSRSAGGVVGAASRGARLSRAGLVAGTGPVLRCRAASGSGSSGGACCTPLITGRS